VDEALPRQAEILSGKVADGLNPRTGEPVVILRFKFAEHEPRDLVLSVGLAEAMASELQRVAGSFR
jgi:hypothetical protein